MALPDTPHPEVPNEELVRKWTEARFLAESNMFGVSLVGKDQKQLLGFVELGNVVGNGVFFFPLTLGQAAHPTLQDIARINQTALGHKPGVSTDSMWQEVGLKHTYFGEKGQNRILASNYNRPTADKLGIHYALTISTVQVGKKQYVAMVGFPYSAGVAALHVQRVLGGSGIVLQVTPQQLFI